jgi:hypothetical protein
MVRRPKIKRETNSWDGARIQAASRPAFGMDYDREVGRNKTSPCAAPGMLFSF